jgi:hypothetical protein
MQLVHRVALIPALIALSACTLKVGDLGELTDTDAQTGPDATTGADPSGTTAGLSGETEAPTTGDPTETTDAETTGSPGAKVDGVDILFVIDNSGSMAQVQERLVDSIASLVDPLIAADLDLRIAVTTTDTGNPRCPAATYAPENGAFVAESCRPRVDQGEFAFADLDFSGACLDHCAHDTIAFAPTTTELDAAAAPRAWIEWGDGAGNIDVPLAEALPCLLPQGVAGCGFESPLEAMYLALAKAGSPGEPNWGFLRTHAHLLVILVTDETDCSFAPDAAEIFIDNKVFWSSPDDPAPTSAVCWRAGVQCTGGPGLYDDCAPVDRGLDGEPTAAADEAVLQPLARYQGILDGIQADKAAAGSVGKVQLAAIAGVPVGYGVGVPLVFADGNPDEQTNFGIGPGCEGDEVVAVPPLRIRELVEQNSPLSPGMHSICQGSLAMPLAGIAGGLGE